MGWRRWERAFCTSSFLGSEEMAKEVRENWSASEEGLLVWKEVGM